MRGSTAAGINISLLPLDCSCGEFACSAVWGRDLFPGICGEFAGGAIQEEPFPLAFVRNLPVALYRKSPLFPGIFGKFVDGAILEEASFPWHL